MITSMHNPKINLKLTGQNIATLRKQKGVTVKQLQTIFNFNHETAIYKWQQGKCLPSVDNLVVLADVLGVSIEDILVIERSNAND